MIIYAFPFKYCTVLLRDARRCSAPKLNVSSHRSRTSPTRLYPSGSAALFSQGRFPSTGGIHSFALESDLLDTTF